MNIQTFLKWAIAITGSVAAIAPAAGLIPGKYGIAVATVAAIALSINKSLVQADAQPK